ncbi:MAG TPA: hypothetical protein VMW48_20940 [Vicinamibacterales bacterium]|nr:hypothetical protein [Vicinamibacterales bacterium]
MTGSMIRAEAGFGLVAVLVWLSVLATFALGVALATSAEPPAAGALHEKLRMTRAAESAVALALATLAQQADWTGAPGGAVPSAFTDGAPGPRAVGGTVIDLIAETNLRTCGRATACDDVATSVSSPARPWGVRNPRWQLLVHQPLASLDAASGAVCPCYLMAWVADDPADADGDPRRDAPVGVDGHGVLLVRGVAFGDAGALGEVEALVAQPCRRSGVACGGIRVQSWGAVRDGVP